jgi:hypothetical protein
MVTNHSPLNQNNGFKELNRQNVQELGATNKQWGLFLQPFKIVPSDATMLYKSEALISTAGKM